MKVAYFSPLPPDRSGIADYSALLLTELEKLVEVEAVRAGRTRPVPDADVAVYHIGNNPDAHGWIVDALRRRPGVVVLHEFVLHHLIAGLTIGRKDGHAYLAAMERDAGIPGRLLAHGVLEGRLPPLWEVRPEEFPLVGEILDSSLGVIVHSHYVETKVREYGYEGPVWRVPMPAWPVPAVDPIAVSGAPVFGCFGHMNESKRIPQLLRAFAELRSRHPEAQLLLAGGEAPGFDLAGRLERLGLDTEGVLREQYVEERRLWSLVAACDACVQLRMPTMGETSAAALRTLSLGVPIVVTDIGWFSELPDDVALKVPAGGADEVPALAAALERLGTDVKLRTRMRAAVGAYVEREHDRHRTAELYVAALEEAAGSASVRERVLREIAEAAADVGVETDELAPELVRASLVSSDGHGPALAVPRPGRAARWLAASPMWLWLAGLFVVSATVQLALGLRLASPWIMVDEIVWSDMARSFAATGHFLIRGAHAPYGFVYPLLISPAYAIFGSVGEAYRWARVIDALAISSVVFPAYLLARRVVRPAPAFAAAALAVAVPSMVYAGTLMTENVFYPIFVWVAFALVLMLERPTLRRQIVLLALCGLAFVTRAQTVALVAAVLTAPLVLAWIERGRPRRLDAFKPLYGLAGLAALVTVVVQVARGRSPAGVLGNYNIDSNANYHFWPAVKWLVLHVAELDLSLWVLPFAAFIVLVANARHLDRGMRVFTAAATSLAVWLVLVVALFASQYSQRIEERNLFYLAPLFLVALLAWIERGQPKPPSATVAAAGLAAVLPGAIPFTHLLNQNSQSDAVGLQPWWFVADAWAGRSSVAIATVAVTATLAALFFWLPRRYAAALPALVAFGFVATWLPLEQWTHSFPRLSRSAAHQGIGVHDRSWIDHAVGAHASVAVLYSGGDRLAVWENEFWNKRVARVYELGVHLGGDMPATSVSVDRTTGLVHDSAGHAVSAQYVLTSRRVALVGRPVAADAAHGVVLYRIRGRLRTATQITGLYEGAYQPWSGPHFAWTRSSCTGGTLTTLVTSDDRLFHGIAQRVVVGGTTPARTLHVPADTPGLTFRFPLQPKNGVCRVTLAISPARRPSTVPSMKSSDTRVLGLHFDLIRYSGAG